MSYEITPREKVLADLARLEHPFGNPRVQASETSTPEAGTFSTGHAPAAEAIVYLAAE